MYGTVTMVSLGRVMAVLIALSLLGSPLAALYCNQSDAASMACCRGDMSHCNMPGKTEGCCKRVPAGQDSQTPALKAERVEKGRVGVGSLHLTALLPASAVSVLPSETLFLGSTSGRLPATASPPTSSVLRV